MSALLIALTVLVVAVIGCAIVLPDPRSIVDRRDDADSHWLGRNPDPS